MQIQENGGSPRKIISFLKRKLELREQKEIRTSKQIKSLQQSKRCLLKKTANLSSVINELRSKRLVHEDGLAILKSLPGPNNEFLMQQLAKK